MRTITHGVILEFAGEPAERCCVIASVCPVPRFGDVSRMRADMAKVIVERPRIGSRSPSRKKGYRRHTDSVPEEERARREPMLGRWRGRDKWLNEHLGPMRRFLRSNIGRPWNKVHQELCEFVSFDNAVQAHVLEHIEDYVNEHVTIESRSRVYGKPTWWNSRGQLREGEMYVCPQTGLLMAVRKEKRRTPPRRVTTHSLTQFLRRENEWWEVGLRKLPAETKGLWDLWFEQDVDRIARETRQKEYGGDLFAVSKRPLNRKETKALYARIREQQGRRKGRKRH